MKTSALGRIWERGGVRALMPHRPPDLGEPALLRAPGSCPIPKQPDDTPRMRGPLPRRPGVVPSDRGTPGALPPVRRGPSSQCHCEAVALGKPGLAPSVPRRGSVLPGGSPAGPSGAAPTLPGCLTRDKSGPRLRVRGRRRVSWVFKQRH